MGKTKSKMELIKKEKDRNTTFLKKHNFLKKKVNELAILCDSKAAVIIYGPTKATPQAHPLEPEIWPQNHDEVRELIYEYKGQSHEDRKKRTTLLSDVFEERTKKAQQALSKQRNANFRSKYPTWHSRFNSLKEEDYRNINVLLENIMGNAKAKLEQMKVNNIYHADDVQRQHMMLGKKRRMDSDAGNQANMYYKVDPHQANSYPMQVPGPMPFPVHQHMFQFINHDQNQRMAKFGDEYAGGTSNIVHNALPSKAVYNFPMMEGTLNNINYMNNLARTPPNCYGEGRQPVAQHILEYQPMTEWYNSHQTVAASHHYYEDHKWQV
ncbi:MADS-box domain-containing protein [Heracleum sosnowskyi]|uniref:MADS-box domain-containing protein n=1 Tax=Heracleum sosnowskyi TaxID=360622 RepID=A0AAD8JF90_9APIA|nr:MADS-box domain-containing protein [Heracleum sosnowskyi]